jgi:hypothetical protein
MKMKEAAGVNSQVLSSTTLDTIHIISDFIVQHLAFENARSRFAKGSHPQSAYFEFVEEATGNTIMLNQRKLFIVISSARRSFGNERYGVCQQTRVEGSCFQCIDAVQICLTRVRAQVRKQTRNLVSLLQHCADSSEVYMFMEDDMRLCPHGFDVIQYMLSKVLAVFALCVLQGDA